MIRTNLPIRLMWLISGIIAILCSVTAVIKPGIYDGFVEAKYLYATIGQDVMALIASFALVLIAWKVRDTRYTAQVVGLGLSGFLFYAYGVYVIEQVYNFLYFGYMAIFSLSFFGIIYSLFRIDPRIAGSASMSRGFRKVSAIASLLIPAVFVPLWTVMQANLIITGSRIENTYGVFIMDLCIIMPLFVIAAVLSLKGNPLGIALTPCLFVLGCALLFPVGLAGLLPWLLDGESLDIASILLYDGLSVMFLVLGIVHMRKVRFNTAGEQAS